MRQGRVGYAVIGLGHIAQHAVLPAFRHARKSRLVAVVSGDSQKAQRVGAQFGAKFSYSYDALEECLGNPAVGAVYIASVNGAHPRFATQTAARGKHVLCEKPLANTADECRQMVEVCRANDVRLMTAYRKYFEPSMLALKKLVASGELGRLRSIHTSFTNRLPEIGAWHVDPKLAGGGALMDLGIYCVNAARWLTDMEHLEASAYSWNTNPRRFAAVDENIAFQLKFPEGLVVQGSSSFTAARASFIQIHGEKGWAALNPAFPYSEPRRLFGKIGGRWFERRFRVIDEFSSELDYFADCIRNNREPQPNGIAGLRDVAVVQSIYQAAKTGRPVAIEFPL